MYFTSSIKFLKSFKRHFSLYEFLKLQWKFIWHFEHKQMPFSSLKRSFLKYVAWLIWCACLFFLDPHTWQYLSRLMTCIFQIRYSLVLRQCLSFVRGISCSSCKPFLYQYLALSLTGVLDRLDFSFSFPLECR